jgi:type IV secretion system protein VirD4
VKRDERNIKDQRRVWSSDPYAHGSARWADAAHLRERSYGPDGRHTLGYLPVPGRGTVPVTYGGDRHELIVAPTRGGKGVSGAVPRLLEHPGSVIVLDTKGGELALITALYRKLVFGQKIILIDPEDIVAWRLGMKPASINPIAGLQPYGSNAFADAMAIAEACVMREGHGDSHWDDEAASLIAGLSLFASLDGPASLGAVRGLLNSSKEAFRTIIALMQTVDFELVRAAGNRIDNKEERELASVISTAQRHTHFLENSRLAASLGGEGLDPNDLVSGVSIYIILPGERILMAKRWLRVLISNLMNSVMGLAVKPPQPVLFLLEEMATLERMPIIETAVGLMAGYGLQFTMVVQDFTQLRDIYKDRWETFLANSATIQCFGTNDRFTAEYLSALCGTASVEQLSFESARERAHIIGDPDYRSAGDALIGRRLITPEELMALHPSVQLIKLAAARPVMAYRPVYFLEERFRHYTGQPLYSIHPNFEGKPIPPAFDFTSPRLDLGAVLRQYLSVG